MPDPRLAWYRQRAEEEGNKAACDARAMSARRVATLGVDAASDFIDRNYAQAREAAHYANLVLGPGEECAWRGRAATSLEYLCDACRGTW